MMLGSFTVAIRGQGPPLSDRVLILEEQKKQYERDDAQRHAEMVVLREKVAALQNSVTEMRTAAWVVGLIFSAAISVNIVLQVQVKRKQPSP